MLIVKNRVWGEEAMTMNKLKISSGSVYFGFGNIWILELTLNVVIWFAAI